MTAHRAFQFCKQYKRTTEFRRLCEIIRNHLANLNKYRDQRDRPDLTAPESLQLYLDTRVEQLKIATDLSLWQVCDSSFSLCVCWEKFLVLFDDLLLCSHTGSFPLCGRYSWFDDHGKKKPEAILDGCILCQANRDFLGRGQSPLPCICMAEALYFAEKLQ